MVSYIMYKDKLKDDYLKAFDFVETYAMSIQVPDQENEEMLNNLLDLLYEAQENGQPAEKIVGKDLRQFCADYFQDYTAMQNFIVGLIPMFFRIAVLIFIFSILELFDLKKGTPLSQATTDIGGYLAGILIGILTSLIVAAIARPLLLHWKKFTNRLYIALTIAVLVIALTISFLFLPEKNITVPLFAILLASGGYIVLYLLGKGILHYRKNGTIRKSAEESYTMKDTLKSIWDNESMQDDILEALVKSYQKKNARRAKRGKEPITPQAHTEKVRKDNRLQKYNLPYFIFLFLLFTVPTILSVKFNSILDFIIFCLLMAVLEGLFLRFLYKCCKAGFDKKAALLAQCDAEGITLVELWERQKGEKIF